MQFPPQHLPDVQQVKVSIRLLDPQSMVTLGHCWQIVLQTLTSCELLKWVTQN